MICHRAFGPASSTRSRTTLRAPMPRPRAGRTSVGVTGTFGVTATADCRSTAIRRSARRRRTPAVLAWRIRRPPPMLALALLVTSIALADAINPSTVVPALWLASTPRARGLTSYTVGVFVVYLAGGVVLLFGPGPALIAALHHVRGPIEHALQAAGGGVALAFA